MNIARARGLAEALVNHADIPVSRVGQQILDALSEPALPVSPDATTQAAETVRRLEDFAMGLNVAGNSVNELHPGPGRDLLVADIRALVAALQQAEQALADIAEGRWDEKAAPGQSPSDWARTRAVLAGGGGNTGADDGEEKPC